MFVPEDRAVVQANPAIAYVLRAPLWPMHYGLRARSAKLGTDIQRAVQYATRPLPPGRDPGQSKSVQVGTRRDLGGSGT